MGKALGSTKPQPTSRYVTLRRPLRTWPRSAGGMVLGSTRSTECTIMREGPPNSRASPESSRTCSLCWLHRPLPRKGLARAVKFPTSAHLTGAVEGTRQRKTQRLSPSLYGSPTTLSSTHRLAHRITASLTVSRLAH